MVFLENLERNPKGFGMAIICVKCFDDQLIPILGGDQTFRVFTYLAKIPITYFTGKTNEKRKKNIPCWNHHSYTVVYVSFLCLAIFIDSETPILSA